MLERINVNKPANIQTDSALQKGKAQEAASTPQAKQVSTVFNRCLGLIKAFSKQVQDNQDCHNHTLQMRHSASKTKQVAIPFFQKMKEFVRDKADKLNQNRIVRKLKDMLELLESIDFNFVRSSKSPLLINTMAKAITELLEQYRDFEGRSKQLEDQEHRFEISSLLAAIAKIPFGKDKYHIRNAMVGEVLTKHLVTRALEEGDEIDLPCFTGEEPSIVRYGLHTRMTLGESGIPVLVYAPLEKGDQAAFPPLLLFRGTKVNFTNAIDIRSMVENLHKVGPARHAYDQFKGGLAAFLQGWFKAVPENPHFRVMGFSQGAVLGQRALVDFYPYFERKLYQESLLFNSPALEEDYYNLWEAIPSEQKPSVFIYLATNDLVSKRGYRFAADHIFEIKPRDPKKWLGAHLGAKFIDPELEVFEVDNTGESDSNSRKLVNQLCSSGAVEMVYKNLAPRLAAAATAKPNPAPRSTRQMG